MSHYTAMGESVQTEKLVYSDRKKKKKKKSK